ncbi:MAG: ABC transporter ATP-binding protein [Flavobacteriaceae bacterium]|nr:ABC transporter ATP-binding protein [Flavobacteriaceae bacterium]
MKINPLLSVKNLSISFKKEDTYRRVLHSINFDVQKNEILGVVGESGSGKSITALAVMQLLKNAKVEGDIVFNQLNLNYTTEIESIRGKKISMIFQEPMSALNPSMKCGRQVSEILLQHENISETEANNEVINLFERVKIPMPKQAFEKYPHELSGGQQQRVMIAMAIACKPDLLIADEPTTALDVTVQNDIISLIQELQKETQMSVLFISHDLALVSEIAHKTLVMYKGEVVEYGPTDRIFKHPKNEYTKALIAARPSLEIRLKKLPTVDAILGKSNFSKKISKKERAKKHKQLYNGSPLLEVVNLEKMYYSNIGILKKQTGFKAVGNVSFKLYEGETLGLVGESGCGKSTLGKAILQLDKATAGSVFYRGHDLQKMSKREIRKLRKEIQIIFQDPFASLNPRLTVGAAIMEPMTVHKLYKNKSERKLKALELLEKVGLEAACFDRYPHEFSGGQRQRIGIARTIAVEPKLILCDESVSALDISVQAQVLNLLNALKEDYGFTYIFISHDLAVVKYMADQLLIMNQGKIVESGEADDIYKAPKNAYTKRLIDAIPKGL